MNQDIFSGNQIPASSVAKPMISSYTNRQSSRSIRVISPATRRAESSKHSRQVPTSPKKSENSPKKEHRSPTNWVSSLNEVVTTPRKRSNSFSTPSPSAYLLFPSPHSPTTRTPRTLRQIIDDSGFHVLKESPLSARDSYYSPDLNLDINGKAIPSFDKDNTSLSSSDYSITPSPRAMSTRNNHQDFSNHFNHIAQQESKSLVADLNDYHKDRLSPLPKLDLNQKKSDFDAFFDLRDFGFNSIKSVDDQITDESDNLEIIDFNAIIEQEEAKVSLPEKPKRLIPKPPTYKNENSLPPRSGWKTNQAQLPVLEKQLDD